MCHSQHTYAMPKKSLAFGMSFMVSLAAVWSIGSMLSAGGVFAASREAPITVARIAVLLPQGSLSFAADYARAGAELAVADLAASSGTGSGVKVELSYDAVSENISPAQAGALVERLAAQRTAAIVGLTSSFGGQELLEPAAAKKIPLIALGATDDRLSIGPSSKWLFRLSSSQDQDISALAFDATEQLPDARSQNLAVLASSDAESSRAAAFLRLQLGANSGADVTLYGPNQIAQLAKARPAKVFLVSLETSLVMLPKLFAAGLTGRQIELVQSNLADYSSQAWAKSMTGACGLLPSQELAASLAARIAKRLALPAETGSGTAAGQSNATLALAAKSYDAIKLAAGAMQPNAGSPQPQTSTALRLSLQGASMPASVGPKGNQISFNAQGFQATPDYQRVCYEPSGRYQNAGRYSLAASG